MPASSIDRAGLLVHTGVSWPPPARGYTAGRWRRLAALGEQDLPLAKLVEPHHDARAILADLATAPADPDDIWAVWAAEPPFAVLQARDRADGWTVTGRKAFCSGAELVSRALVTARAADGSRLFAVRLPDDGITIDHDSPAWTGPGMARAETVTLAFDEVRAVPVGAVDAYTDRAGFWWGAIGIAAIWFGGARGVARVLEDTRDRLDAHGLAHLGAVRAELDGLALIFDAAARAADTGELEVREVERLALVVRARTSDVVESVISHVGRASGPGPLAFDSEHAARVADLQVFVRQHHGERDLESLGSMERADA
jgi:alkylation response protein AidB-like acyl-CoA dehydrogenase